MVNHRDAYLLTTDPTSNRTIYSKDVLGDIGFTVHVVQHTPHTDPVVSNRISMMNIYNMIQQGDKAYAYVFEDDIDVHEEITLDEIIMYERLSDKFFYLGICEDWGKSTTGNTGHSVRSHNVVSISGNVRGLHAMGLSKTGARDLLQFSHTSQHVYMDMVLEDFTRIYPANVVRYDLQSYIPGHRGMFFQARDKFPTTIHV